MNADRANVVPCPSKLQEIKKHWTDDMAGRLWGPTYRVGLGCGHWSEVSKIPTRLHI